MSVNKYLTLLSDTDLDRVHQAILNVLEEVVLWLPNKEVLQILEVAGAQVDFEKETVRYPADMVTKTIDQSATKAVENF